jgi:hypothetical protein
LLLKELDKVNKTKEDIHMEHGRIFVNDVDEELLNGSLWVKKKDRYYLTTPEDFYLYDEGKPKETNNKILKIYNSCKNKCIITIRKQKNRFETEQLLKDLSIELPNKGLFMFPYVIIKNKGEWKSTIIKQLLDRYKKVVYFDDDIKILKRMKRELEGENIDLYNIKNDKIRKIN